MAHLPRRHLWLVCPRRHPWPSAPGAPIGRLSPRRHPSAVRPWRYRSVVCPLARPTSCPPRRYPSPVCPRRHPWPSAPGAPIGRLSPRRHPSAVRPWRYPSAVCTLARPTSCPPRRHPHLASAPAPLRPRRGPLPPLTWLTAPSAAPAPIHFRLGRRRAARIRPSAPPRRPRPYHRGPTFPPHRAATRCGAARFPIDLAYCTLRGSGPNSLPPRPSPCRPNPVVSPAARSPPLPPGSDISAPPSRNPPRFVHNTPLVHRPGNSLCRRNRRSWHRRRQ